MSEKTAMLEHKEIFQDSLLHWYDREHRILPWREDPTPYHVWISEIMLQQTRVEAVHGYYLRFIGRLPDVRSLAEISDEELNKLWEGLGYYSRARNLKKAAEIVVREYGGALPASYDELLKLPGIGSYTAGAIASIAFRQGVPAVDGNVIRVMARLTGCSADTALMSTKKEMEETVKLLIPEGKAHLFNQALMELGALICIPNGAPKCRLCPVGDWCYAKETGMQALLPVRRKKKDRRIEAYTVLIFVDRQGRVLIQKRGGSGLLAGMWEFPMLAGHLSESELTQFLEQSGVSFEIIERVAAVRHIFTHIEWHMEGRIVYVDSDFTLDNDSDTISDTDSSDFVACATYSSGSADFVSDLQDDWNTSKSFNREKRARASIFGECCCSFIREKRHWSSMEELKRVYPFPTAFKKYVSEVEEKIESKQKHIEIKTGL